MKLQFLFFPHRNQEGIHSCKALRSLRFHQYIGGTRRKIIYPAASVPCQPGVRIAVYLRKLMIVKLVRILKTASVVPDISQHSFSGFLNRQRHLRHIRIFCGCPSC